MLAFIFGILLAIDPATSTAQFSVDHVFVEHVNGAVPILRVSLDVPEGSLIPTSVEAELDARRLHTDDSDRDAALQSADWFDTKQFPTWSFTSTKISPAPGGFVMNGRLTIHGVSQSQTLKVTISGTPRHAHYHATGSIDRHAFGMKKNRLDPVIGNQVDVTIDIGAVVP